MARNRPVSVPTRYRGNDRVATVQRTQDGSSGQLAYSQPRFRVGPRLRKTDLLNVPQAGDPPTSGVG